MERSAFKKYFDIYYLPLCMYALRILNNKEDAEDIVQAGFASAWEKLQDGSVIANIQSYLYGAVRNLAYSRLRSSNIQKEELTEDIKTEDVDNEDIDTSERDARLWKAIGELPEKCRMVFLMSKRDGLSNNEIAEELNISVKTVENQMTKAFSRLREALLPEGRRVFFLPFL